MKNPAKIDYILWIIGVITMVLMFHSCAPVFSEMQSARTVGDGRAEVTPMYSTVGYREEGESEVVQTQLGVQFAYGLNDKFDLRARYEAIWIEDVDEEVISVFGIGPKFSLLEDKIAFYIPVGNAIGSNYNDNWQMHPTFLFSIPIVKDEIELTIAPKYLMTFCSDCDDGLAFNFGAAFGNLNTWAIRLEYGLLYGTQDFGDGHNSHLSVGVSYAFGKPKQVK